MAVRAMDLWRAAVGARTLRADPALLIGRPATPAEHVVVGLLGLRHIAQAAVTARTGWRTLGVGVDLLHGLSMVALAVAAPRRYGRAGRAQAIAATVLVVMGLVQGASAD